MHNNCALKKGIVCVLGLGSSRSKVVILRIRCLIGLSDEKRAGLR